MIRTTDPRQANLPQTAPDVRALLQRRAASRMRASQEQKPCDIGLFSDEADQLDLVGLYRE